MYDMYPWDSHAPATPLAHAPRPAEAVTADPAVRAVQVALDRRDNGGDPADEAK
jgi:hypothetical protein